MNVEIEERMMANRLRADNPQEGDGFTLWGYAANFNQETVIYNMFREVIRPGAFDPVLGDDVRCVRDHIPSQILGRTTANTLRLSVDETGLRYLVKPPDTSYANDLMVSVRRGDVTQSSFKFTVDQAVWHHSEKDDELPLREIMAFERLYDVSPVTYPAYPGTSIEAARSIFASCPIPYSPTRQARRAREIELYTLEAL